MQQTTQSCGDIRIGNYNSEQHAGELTARGRLPLMAGAGNWAGPHLHKGRCGGASPGTPDAASALMCQLCRRRLPRFPHALNVVDVA